MELTFYDADGRAIAYCDDERHIYAFSGVPVAYLEGDSVWAFDGRHLGWWHAGWILDHDGAAVAFTDMASGYGPKRPAMRPQPTKGLKGVTPRASMKQIKPVPFRDGDRWSRRSGAHFFPSM